MPAKNKPIKELSMARTLDAPIDAVWKACTTPKLFSKWWAPKMFAIPECKLDVRKGGAMRVVMHGPAGTAFDMDMPVKGEYKEVAAPHRLAFINSPLDGNGLPLFEVLETVELEEQGGKTKMSLNAKVVRMFIPKEQAAPYLGGMDQGFAESMENLEDLLNGKNR
ncbi:MAG: SRPBCC domain-containing protein [Candidatus Micrarchaeia archaeon]